MPQNIFPSENVLPIPVLIPSFVTVRSLQISAEIGHKVPFRSLRLSAKVSLYHDTQMYHNQSDTKTILGFYYIASRPQF